MIKFQHFSKVTKFHQTCRIYLNHHQKHACEILSPFREVNLFHIKMPTVPALEISIFSTFFQSLPNFIKLAEHIGIIIRNMQVKYEPIQRGWLIHRKMLTVPALEISWNFNIFSKFTNFYQTLLNILESSSETCM